MKRFPLLVKNFDSQFERDIVELNRHVSHMIENSKNEYIKKYKKDICKITKSCINIQRYIISSISNI